MQIYKAAVVGAGTMGTEIAQVISAAGIPVLLKDIDEAFVERGLEKARQIYSSLESKGVLSPQEAREKSSLLRGTVTYDGFEDVDIAIEAVVEDLETKKPVFRELDSVCPPDAILATNTSSLSISALGAATGRPHKVLGLHFFFPAHLMQLVEVIPGLDTSQETVSDGVRLVERLGRAPVRVKECPGFLVNRLLLAYLTEAVLCVEERAAQVIEIDRAMRQWGFPMGPFILMDSVGLDICLSVGRTLHDAYGPRMECGQLLSDLTTAGRYGRKSGAGFYRWPGGRPLPDEELGNFLPNESPERKPQPPSPGRSSFSPDRLLLRMVNEAAMCLEEEVAAAGDIERALLAGIAFPKERGGLLRYADSLGLDAVLDQLTAFARELGPRFWPAPYIKRLVAGGHIGSRTGRGFLRYS
jgi:3-hydroxyacyl-CoA dehydrogenase